MDYCVSCCSSLDCFYCIFLLQTFARCTGISLSGPAEDPKVASWLLDPGAKEKNLHQLVGQHLPEEAPLLEGLLLFYFNLPSKSTTFLSSSSWRGEQLGPSSKEKSSFNFILFIREQFRWHVVG